MALDWFNKKSDAKPAAPFTLADSGSAQAPAAGTPSSPSSSASASIIEGRKTRADAGRPRGPRGEKLTPDQAAVAASFAELYRPEVWEGIVCAPADTMLSVSGRKLWDVSPRERTTLSVTAGMTAKCFAVENPKWLALAMLCITVSQIYGTRIALHMAERADEKKKEKAKALSDAKPNS